MKQKFILIIMAVVLVVALITLAAMPVISPAGDTGVLSEGVAADLAVMDSEAVLIADNNIAPVPAGGAGEMSMWIALGASLLTITIACRRGLNKLSNAIIMSLRRLSDSTGEGSRTAGGPNKFILPSAA